MVFAILSGSKSGTISGVKYGIMTKSMTEIIINALEPNVIRVLANLNPSALPPLEIKLVKTGIKAALIAPKIRMLKIRSGIRNAA